MCERLVVYLFVWSIVLIISIIPVNKIHFMEIERANIRKFDRGNVSEVRRLVTATLKKICAFAVQLKRPLP